ncbi:hypothetical protein BH766_gp90 [Gordonia phage Demosthenes]|uniref:Uncharacterized protein n=1 Tax=Gordonia phage Demosthenes TaxID=1838067 RepID=A0A160DE62_9CAUD|nr:hypothetical protein BH766_gp90 [Gordonia phage Demosthenes]ANA86059.1 hypothetical protein PBI_DEMOSTHENES_90 [Gordonia phage Demosthenes]
MPPRSKRELNRLTDHQLATLQDDLYERRHVAEVEAKRVADIRHERLLGIRKRNVED